MTENELCKFLKEQDAVYKKAEDVLRARGVDVLSIDSIEQCGTSDVKVSFAFRWDKVAEHDCIVIPMSDFVEQENKEKTTMTELQFRVIPNQVQFSRLENTSFPSTIPDKVLDVIIANYSLVTWRLHAYSEDYQEFMSDLKQRIVAAYFDEITYCAHGENVVTDSRVITKLIRQTLESDTNEPIIVYLKKWITLVVLNYLLWSSDQGDAELLYDVNSNPKLCYTKQEEKQQ